MPKFDFLPVTPYLNAAGSLGFAPDRQALTDFGALGAFFTNPISARPRQPAQQRGVLEFPGGFVLHSGYPNPGLRRAIERCRKPWQQSPFPIVVHLLADEVQETAAMVRQLEGLEGVMGIELGVGPENEPGWLEAVLENAVGELPVIVRLPLERAADLAQSLGRLPVSAISFAPPYGTLPDANGRLLRGRCYGPGVFPLALKALQDCLPLGIPVIAAGGVTNLQQAELLLKAGASAVQLDYFFWQMGRLPG